MKNVILALVLLVAGKASAQQVEAMPIINPAVFNQVANLTKIKMDERMDVEIQSAQVIVNTVRRKVTLSLHPKQPCEAAQPGQFRCMAIIPDTVITLPLVKTEKGTCGATVHTAVLDRTPVDGNRVEIQVVDNRTLVCKIAVQKDRMTVVTYKVSGYSRLQGEQYEYVSLLTGERLHGQFENPEQE